ncbi:18S rRNA (guanine1575-N7)-methyltransferase [Exophiala dermatitidis]|nr:18S rRNA (guanine1575-N7)-methyltransferase [Exophiala dermatitidis]KAJ4539282.1 18S rRNA (guanine1575-N7)-methyltransferase [Exophiala dermatitidis]
MSRPEDLLPPDLYYNDTESAKYTTSSRIQAIQASMTNRALELLDLQEPSFILDIGCGSGLSGEILSEDGHIWRESVEGDLFLADMGQGIPFRAGTFDAAISISAIQWLCNAETSGVSPEGRLRRFFDGLYASLRRGARAVCQFYPKNEQQRTMISQAAVRAGFGAGILEDDGGTKNQKTYLVLSVGGGDITGTVSKMEGVDIEDGRKLREAMQKGRRKGDDVKGSKQWIMKKKEKMRNKGKVVKSDSKYTGRRRGPKF